MAEVLTRQNGLSDVRERDYPVELAGELRCSELIIFDVDDLTVSDEGLRASIARSKAE